MSFRIENKSKQLDVDLERFVEILIDQSPSNLCWENKPLGGGVPRTVLITRRNDGPTPIAIVSQRWIEIAEARDHEIAKIMLFVGLATDYTAQTVRQLAVSDTPARMGPLGWPRGPFDLAKVRHSLEDNGFEYLTKLGGDRGGEYIKEIRVVRNKGVRFPCAGSDDEPFVTFDRMGVLIWNADERYAGARMRIAEILRWHTEKEPSRPPTPRTDVFPVEPGHLINARATLDRLHAGGKSGLAITSDGGGDFLRVTTATGRYVCTINAIDGFVLPPMKITQGLIPDLIFVTNSLVWQTPL